MENSLDNNEFDPENFEWDAVCGTACSWDVCSLP